MKFFISLIVTALLSFVLCLYLPWWSIAIAAFSVAALIPQKPAKSFWCGFLALFLLWGGLSLWLSINNEHILAKKISMLILKMDSPYMMVLITAIIGALVAGLAALTGSYARLSKKAV